MALATAIRGARHRGQKITWTSSDSIPGVIDLTGATLTGKKRNLLSDEVTTIEGTLEKLTAPNEMQWIYAAEDVASEGDFEVQFIASYNDGTEERSFIENWKVEKSL